MKKLKVFISYSRKDEYLTEELIKHLAVLKHNGLIETWYDRQIDAGEEWNEEIVNELRSADIILLMVSSDLLASQYCFNVEIKLALERHDKNEAIVIPVIARSCLWKDYQPISKLQAVPKDADPIINWDSQDQAYLSVVKGIKARIESFEKTESQKLITHKISIITGLTSSGKDAIISDIAPLLHKRSPNYYHFLKKYISRRKLRDDEKPGSGLPYEMNIVKRSDLQNNPKGKYFNVYPRYTNYVGFEYKELETVIKNVHDQRIIFVYSGIENLESLKLGLNDLRSKLEKAFNKAHSEYYKLLIEIDFILIKCTPNNCKSRLYRRNMPPNIRAQRQAKIEYDWQIVQKLIKDNFFDKIVDNSNEIAFKTTTSELEKHLSL